MFFNFLKSKPTLKELIPEGFVDIHSHILPGIDDGAKDVEESKKIIGEMKELGFKKIIATPHTYPGMYENTNDSILNSFNILKGSLDLDIEINFASEYMSDRSVIDKAENKSLLCLKDNYVLIEMSFLKKYDQINDLIFKLKINGYTPILAHPERYLYFHKSLDKLNELRRRGCLLQMNIISITGYYGRKFSKISNRLLALDYIDFVGSDIHNLNHIKQFDQKVLINSYETKKIVKIMERTSDLFA